MPAQASGLEDALDAVVIRMTPDGEVLDASAKARSYSGCRRSCCSAAACSSASMSPTGSPICARWPTCATVPPSGARWSCACGCRPRSVGRNDGQLPGLFPGDRQRRRRGAGAVRGAARERRARRNCAQAAAAARDGAAGAEVAKGRFLRRSATSCARRSMPSSAFPTCCCMRCSEPSRIRGRRNMSGWSANSGQHLLAVVNSILDVSRIEAGAYATEPNRSVSPMRSTCAGR